jgi:hypothetical protein
VSAALAEPAAGEPIAGYKSFLRACIERRPSGLRGKLAQALGKHRSFVSQITNPAYRVPIPAGDLAIILEVCHLSPAERERFLELYGRAHPDRRRKLAAAVAGPRELKIALPRFRHDATGREVESLILEFAARTIRMAQRIETDETSEGGPA